MLSINLNRQPHSGILAVALTSLSAKVFGTFRLSARNWAGVLLKQSSLSSTVTSASTGCSGTSFNPFVLFTLPFSRQERCRLAVRSVRPCGSAPGLVIKSLKCAPSVARLDALTPLQSVESHARRSGVGFPQSLLALSNISGMIPTGSSAERRIASIVISYHPLRCEKINLLCPEAASR